MMHFNMTKEFEELEAELKEAFEEGEYDDCVDIIVDIEQARRLFNSNLPDWYSIRWSTSYVDDVKTWEEAFRVYQNNVMRCDNE